MGKDTLFDALENSPLAIDMMKLATDTLHSLLKIAMSNNLPPRDFEQYIELFGDSMILIAHELVTNELQKSSTNDSAGYIEIDVDKLDV